MSNTIYDSSWEQDAQRELTPEELAERELQIEESRKQAEKEFLEKFNSKTRELTDREKRSITRAYSKVNDRGGFIRFCYEFLSSENKLFGGKMLTTFNSYNKKVFIRYEFNPSGLFLISDDGENFHEVNLSELRIII